MNLFIAAFFALINTSTGQTEGAFSDRPEATSGYEIRELSVSEKTLLDGRKPGQFVIKDGSALRYATFDEGLLLMSLPDAVEAIFNSITNPVHIARLWPMRDACKSANRNGVPYPIIRIMIQGVDVSDDAELQQVKAKILALPQWPES